MTDDLDVANDAVDDHISLYDALYHTVVTDVEVTVEDHVSVAARNMIGDAAVKLSRGTAVLKRAIDSRVSLDIRWSMWP